jgi:hypothetical protein
MDKLGVAMIAGLALVGVMILLALFGAFTISTLWSWFVVPFGVQTISLAHAYGLSVLASVFMSIRGLSNTKAADALTQGVMLNIFALLLGFITVQFM